MNSRSDLPNLSPTWKHGVGQCRIGPDSVAQATSNSPVTPEIVCYYFAKGDFRKFGERLGVATTITDIHPLNPYVGTRFNVIFTRR